MKLAVINFSGNVGKTTVSRHLLAPRIPGCQVVAVESINADDGQPVTIRGRQFAQLQEFLQSVDNVVVDIGASNVEELLKLMRRYRDSQQGPRCARRSMHRRWRASTSSASTLACRDL